MSGIPRSGIARPSRLAPPGSIKAPTSSVGGVNKRNAEDLGNASKKPRTVGPSSSMKRPAVTPAPTTVSRRPLANRNASVNRTGPSALNKTVASSQPTVEKPKGKIKNMTCTLIFDGINFTFLHIGKPKRAAWDIKGKLEDMEVSHKETLSRLAALESQNNVLKTDVNVNSDHLSTAKKENSELLSKYFYATRHKESNSKLTLIIFTAMTN